MMPYNDDDDNDEIEIFLILNVKKSELKLLNTHTRHTYILTKHIII